MKSRLLSLLAAPALTLAMTLSPANAAAATPQTGLYDGLLRTHVDADGYVDYDGLLADRADLDTYIESLADVDRSTLSEDDDLAFLINAYNALTLQLILDHYDGGNLKSIKEINDGKPWSLEVGTVAGKEVTLDDIEHKTIREDFDEPRIHWAVVCAAWSCPPLRNEAYTGNDLETQLDAQEKYIFNPEHPRYIRRNPNGGWAVTPILKWYGDDFGVWQDYALERLPKPDLVGGLLDYSWRLNSQKNKRRKAFLQDGRRWSRRPMILVIRYQLGAG